MLYRIWSFVLFTSLFLTVLLKKSQVSFLLSGEIISNTESANAAPTTDVYSTAATFVVNRHNTTQVLRLEKYLSTQSKVGGMSSRECENQARELVYKQDLCGAPDPESYTTAALGRLTCKHRCGVAPKAGRLWSECGCDELCVVFSYCCRDIAVQCPDLYWKSQQLKVYVQEKQLELVCAYNTLTFQPKKDSGEKKEFVELSSKVLKKSLSSIEPELNTKDLNEPTLHHIVTDLQLYKVADLKKGILYNNYGSFLSAAEPTTKPNFVPIVARLDCPHMPRIRNQQSNIAELFLWCSTSEVWNLKTKFDRDCSKDMLFSCNCEDRFFYHKRLHDVCLAKNQSSEYRAETALGLVDPTEEILMTWNSRKIGCMLFNSTKTQSFKNFHNLVFKITTIPVVIKPSWSSFHLYTNTKDRSNQRVTTQSLLESEGNNAETKAIEIYDQVQVVIKSTQTLETRLVCPGRKSCLSECHLAECAPGALLSFRPVAPWKFGSRSCEVPRHAVVSSKQHKLPVCVCMRTLAALESLQLWKTYVTRSQVDECSLNLHLIFHEETKRATTFYTFPKDQNQLITEPSTLADLKDRVMASLMTSQALCDNKNSPKNIVICFYASETETEGDAIGCLDLVLVSASQNHSGWAGRNVVAVFLAIIIFLSFNNQN